MYFLPRLVALSLYCRVVFGAALSRTLVYTSMVRATMRLKSLASGTWPTSVAPSRSWWSRRSGLVIAAATTYSPLTISGARHVHIGAVIYRGVQVDGQVLVLHDMLGVNLGKMPKFVRNFMADGGSIRGAMEAYVAAVKNGSFPDNALHAW